MTARYDFVLQGGEIIDPASGLRGAFDIAFAGGRVAAVQPAIDAVSASRVERVDGLLVVPGLIDMHVHVFDGIGIGTNADIHCLRRGSTTVVDGGTAGAHTFGAFHSICSQNQARVLAWLNLSTIGQVDMYHGELVALLHADVAAAVETAKAYPDMIVGLKARLSTYAAGGSCLPVLGRLREAGDESGLPVMVHIGDTGEPLRQILALLRPGDTVSHCLTGRNHGLLRAVDGRIIPEAFEARERGVLFDAAHGRWHVNFNVLEAAVEQGFLPDILSTDVNRFSGANADFSMPLMGTLLLSFGVSLEEVVARMTLYPAQAIRRADLGSLQAGAAGDATLLRLEEGAFTLVDTDGRMRTTGRRLVAAGVVREGRYLALA